MADAIYVMLERFLRRIETEGKLYTLTEKITFSDNDMTQVYQDKFDMTKSPMLKAIAAAGFRLVTEEGQVFPVIDHKRMLDFFGTKVTPAMQKYLEMNWEELAEPTMSDAHLAIEPEKLVDRCVFWENFNKAHPFFVRSGETKEHERFAYLPLINGICFDDETKAPFPEYAKAWAYGAQRYPQSDIGKTLAEFTQLLAREGNKRTPKVEAFQDAIVKKYGAL